MVTKQSSNKTDPKEELLKLSEENGFMPDKVKEEWTKIDAKKRRLELIQEAKDMGLKSITIEGVVYEIGDQAKAKVIEPITEQEASDLLKPMSMMDDLTDDEILYWSSPFYDEIQANKELREKQIKEQE